MRPPATYDRFSELPKKDFTRHLIDEPRKIVCTNEMLREFRENLRSPAFPNNIKNSFTPIKLIIEVGKEN